MPCGMPPTKRRAADGSGELEAEAEGSSARADGASPMPATWKPRGAASQPTMQENLLKLVKTRRLQSRNS